MWLGLAALKWRKKIVSTRSFHGVVWVWSVGACVTDVEVGMWLGCSGGLDKLMSG